MRVKDKGERRPASLLPYYGFILPLQFVARHLPMRLGQRLGAGVGALLYHGVKRYRETARRNLQASFEWDADQAELVARQVFQNIGKTLIEFLRMPTLSEDQLRSMFRLEGLE